MLRKWYYKLFGKEKNTQFKARVRRRNAALPLRLEALEDRVVPANLTTLASFAVPAPSAPAAGLIQDSSGNLFGTSIGGGIFGDGTVFEIAKGSNTATTLASFNYTNGAHPYAGLIQDSNGNLFGTTTQGGQYGRGTVFEIAQGSNTITSLASFNGSNGTNPYASLIEDSSGNLYGTTESGGASGDGTVFEVAKGSNTIATLASFNGSNGANPYSSLVEDSSGNLFGTTQFGGASGQGTVFEVAQGSNTITTLVSFNYSSNGAYPLAALIEDSSGNLFGTTASGGNASGHGTVFEIAKGSYTLTTLASFGYQNAYPLASLLQDSNGNLFGTTEGGGVAGNGTVFELAQGSHTITTLASFNGSNGSHPVASLVEDSSGNLFGTTESGGVAGYGTVFEIAQGSNTITTLTSFTTPDPVNPYGGLIQDSSGNLFGTSIGGGIFGDGTVFELAKGSNTTITLASFNGRDGANPEASLIQDSSGNLFGTTFGGGAFRDGTVFEIAKGSNTITTLASFNFSNGAYPLAGLIQDSSGNLFGTTYGGGASGDGTVFEIAQGSNTITTLASFNGSNGAYPYGGLVEDSNGDLFGTTEGGGASGKGTVFEIAQGSNTITTLASFNGSNGANPSAGLILDSSGNLFGTTRYGGASGYAGTVFEIAQGSNTITTLASFNNSNGAYPYGGLVEDSNGDLFGTTEGGGASGKGTVFEIAQGSNTITTLASFNGSNGANPYAGLIQDSSGNLFGTTLSGASGGGTVFEVQVTIKPSLSVNDASGTYNGYPFPAVGTALGADGKPVSGSWSYAYYVGSSATGTPSATAPSDAGTYTVVGTFASSDSRYTGGTAQTTFTITQAMTSFSNLTVQQIIVGTSTTTLSGQLTSNTIVPVGQSVSITLNGLTQSATVGANGSFSASFATGALNVGAYTISYSYGGDNNFTAATGTGSLTVAYGSQLLFNNSKPVHSGADLPIKLALTDASGADISSPSIAVTATSLVNSNGNAVSLKSAGNANPNDLFRYDASLGGYIFNLDTKGLAAGTYTLYYKAGNDPTLHSLTFVVD